MAKILLVEDDLSLSAVISACLRSDKHLVDVAHDGNTAMASAKLQPFDLFILDWNLPDISGLEICKLLRSQRNYSPVMMLTAKGTPKEKAEALDAGADDYIVKPFEPTELLARVRALLRRPAQVLSPVLKIGELELDTNTMEATYQGNKTVLSAKEAAILELLMRYPQQAFSAEALLQRLWSSDSNSSVDTVRTHIKTLRKKLGDTEEAPVIRSTRNIGYRLALQ